MEGEKQEEADNNDEEDWEEKRIANLSINKVEQNII